MASSTQDPPAQYSIQTVNCEHGRDANSGDNWRAKGVEDERHAPLRVRFIPLFDAAVELTRTLLYDLAQCFIDSRRIWKELSNIGLQDDNICTLSVQLSVLADHCVSEIVLLQHFYLFILFLVHNLFSHVMSPFWRHKRDAEKIFEEAKTASEDATARARSIAIEAEEAAGEAKDAKRSVEKASKELESLFRESSGR